MPQAFHFSHSIEVDEWPGCEIALGYPESKLTKQLATLTVAQAVLES